MPIPSRILEQHLSRNLGTKVQMDATHSPLAHPRKSRWNPNGTARGTLPGAYIARRLDEAPARLRDVQQNLTAVDQFETVVLNDIASAQRRSAKMHGSLAEYTLAPTDELRKSKQRAIQRLKAKHIVDTFRIWNPEKAKPQTIVVSRVHRGSRTNVLDDASWVNTRARAIAESLSGIEVAALGCIWQYYSENGLWPSAEVFARLCQGAFVIPDGFVEHLQASDRITLTRMDSNSVYVRPSCDEEGVDLLPLESDIAKRLVTASWQDTKKRQTARLSPTEQRVWHALKARNEANLPAACIADVVDDVSCGMTYRTNAHDALQKLVAAGLIVMIPDPMPGSRTERAILVRDDAGKMLSIQEINDQVMRLYKRENWISQLGELSASLTRMILDNPAGMDFAELRAQHPQTTPRNISKSLERLQELKLLRTDGSGNDTRYYFTTTGVNPLETWARANEILTSLEPKAPTGLAATILQELQTAHQIDAPNPSAITLAERLQVTSEWIFKHLHDLELAGYIVLVDDPVANSELKIPILLSDATGWPFTPEEVFAQKARLTKKERVIELIGPTQRRVYDALCSFGRAVRYTELYAALPEIGPSKIREACLKLRDYQLANVTKMTNGRDVEVSVK